MIIVSAVRDFAMYNRLVKDNPFNAGAKFVCFDNNVENKTIPIRYNSFLDSYDYSHEDWFIFCHEDWEVLEDWRAKFAELDKNAIYGPIGLNAALFGAKLLQNTCGQIQQSHRTGNTLCRLGQKVKTGTKVQTIDCQCIIVHSSLIKKYNLRFDENLSFDLYAEDFCADAMEKFAIPTKIFQLNCRHYSFGSLEPRFNDQLQYLQNKYAGAKYGYSTTASKVYFGNLSGINLAFLLAYLSQAMVSFLFQQKITNSGKKCIKICKIQLPQFIVRQVWK